MVGRDAEAIALSMQLHGAAQCSYGCARYATQYCWCASSCDEHRGQIEWAEKIVGMYEWQPTKFAAKARRLEKLLTGE